MDRSQEVLSSKMPHPPGITDSIVPTFAIRKLPSSSYFVPGKSIFQSRLQKRSAVISLNYSFFDTIKDSHCLISFPQPLDCLRTTTRGFLTESLTTNSDPGPNRNV